MRPALSSIAALILVSACAAGPDYRGPPMVADAGAHSAFVRAADPSLIATPGLARWWESLNDPVLSGLIDDALTNSPTIAMAEARIGEARGKLAAQNAGQYPSVSASGVYLHAKLPPIGIGGGNSQSSSPAGASPSAPDSTQIDFYNLALMASWEPDLFGAKRRGIEQAKAGVAQRYADLADAQVSLSAQVAQAYVSLRDVEARARLNARSSALQRQALELTRQRYAAGTASALAVERLQNQLDSTDAQNTPLAAQIDGYRDQLALLTGRTPGALDKTLAGDVAVPLPPAKVAIGDPAALIAHRPDVRSAERTLAASTAAIGVNRARQFPSISFLGLLGLGGTELSDALDAGNLTSIAAPMLSWSFLDFGRNRAAVHQAEAQRDEAEAQYRLAVLKALQDAESSLSRFGAARLQLAQLVSAKASADRAAALNNQRVAAGTSSLIDQLDIERQRLSAQSAVEQSKAELTNSYIAVQKALGLGWSDPGERISGG